MTEVAVVCLQCARVLSQTQARKFAVNFVHQLRKHGTRRRGPFCSVACRALDQTERAQVVYRALCAEEEGGGT